MKKILAIFRASFLWLLLLPYILIYTGAASNQLVLIANGDKFPVMVNAYNIARFEAQEKQREITAADEDFIPLPNDMLDSVHCIMTHQTHLNFLADVFDLKDGTYSIGDFGIIAGEQGADIIPFVWLGLIIYREKQRLA